jgi:hypothetical protein
MYRLFITIASRLSVDTQDKQIYIIKYKKQGEMERRDEKVLLLNSDT